MLVNILFLGWMKWNLTALTSPFLDHNTFITVSGRHCVDVIVSGVSVLSGDHSPSVVTLPWFWLVRGGEGRWGEDVSALLYVDVGLCFVCPNSHSGTQLESLSGSPAGTRPPRHLLSSHTSRPAGWDQTIGNILVKITIFEWTTRHTTVLAGNYIVKNKII